MKDKREKLHKEFKLNVSEKLNVSYETYNRLEPNVIYMTFKGWMRPNVDIDMQALKESITSLMKSNIRQLLATNPSFDERFIFDIDLCSKNAQIRKDKILDNCLLYKAKRRVCQES